MTTMRWLKYSTTPSITPILWNLLICCVTRPINHNTYYNNNIHYSSNIYYNIYYNNIHYNDNLSCYYLTVISTLLH